MPEFGRAPLLVLQAAVGARAACGNDRRRRRHAGECWKDSDICIGGRAACAPAAIYEVISK